MSDFDKEADMNTKIWGDKYRHTLGVYESFTLKIEDLIKEITRSADIDVVQIEARTKTIDSFVGKIERKQGKYSNPLTEMTDLIGVRIITYYPEDVDKISQIIEDEFQIDQENSIDKRAALETDQFGYASVHYIAYLNPQRQDLAEWKKFKEIKFEVQIRTALQHAWAAVHHKTDYKSNQAMPESLRRKLFRLSALFEIADEQLSQIRKESSRIESNYEDKVKVGNFDIPLDILSLQVYLEVHPHVKEVREMLVSYGANILSEENPEWSREGEQNCRAILIRVLNMLKITSLSELDQIIQNEIPKIINTAPALVTASKNETPQYLEPFLIRMITIPRNLDKEAFTSVFQESQWGNYMARVGDFQKEANSKKS